jgi:citrate lyase beta subunit
MIHALGADAIAQAADAGRDFVILDLERGRSAGASDLLAADVEACLQQAQDRDLLTMVRVGRNGAPELLKPIVGRADAVMVSDVSGPQDLPASSGQPLIAILERASLLDDIPGLVASGTCAAFCFGPHDLAMALGRGEVVGDPLVVATIAEGIKRLVSLGQIVMVPERPGFDLEGWRRAGVGIFVEPQPDVERR